MTVVPPILGPNEQVPDHPVAATSHYWGDIALLNYLLQDLRALIRRHQKREIDLEPQQVLRWNVHGLSRRTVICDPLGLTGGQQVQVVGFFGERRANADLESIGADEIDLIDEFVRYPGILSYSSIELVDHYWANLVVHLDPQDREAWRSSEIHRQAVNDIAPGAYHAVRIHNGFIRDGVPGSTTVVIESTKYWDYDTDPVWHAIRVLPGGESETLAGPLEPPPA